MEALHLFIIFFNCFWFPDLELYLYEATCVPYHQGFKVWPSVKSSDNRLSVGENILTPKYPAIPKNSHSSATSSKDHPNNSTIEPLWPSLYSSGVFTSILSQIKYISCNWRLTASFPVFIFTILQDTDKPLGYESSFEFKVISLLSCSSKFPNV